MESLCRDLTDALELRGLKGFEIGQSRVLLRSTCLSVLEAACKECQDGPARVLQSMLPAVFHGCVCDGKARALGGA